ncbi:lipase [Photobacterium aphoticum]|uniref:Lipase n=1 Tax=Photobacterium aphoticum TaxID=754436 RepID=A0A090R342_9GAMM|nr:lipase [Photobacterium aphoticum]
MVEHAQKLGIDPDRIAVGGDSAGAGMAAGMVLHNRDAKGPAIALQLLIYPMLDNLHNTPSGPLRTTLFGTDKPRLMLGKCI